MNSIVIKTLAADQIEAACALLYKSYIEDIGWEFSPDNPSHLRVEERNGHKVLLDRFTEHSVWFGAFDHSKLIGCIRIQGVDENNKLEVEGYSTSLVINKFLTADKKDNYVEFGKLAVEKNYYGKNIHTRLILEGLRYCVSNQYSAIACFSNNYLKSVLKSVGWPLKLEHAFKYEEQDLRYVNFYLADYCKFEVNQVVIALENLLINSTRNAAAVLKALEMVAPILPTPVYWHDKNGVVLGANEHCLKGMGTAFNIVGKTPYDFYPKETAELILSHNELVMRTGEILAQEERINDITTGETKYFSSIKAPLYDEGGNVFGIVGSSIDITAEREAARLKIENRAHQAEKAIQEKFKKFIDDVTNLIQSYKIDSLNEKLGLENYELAKSNKIQLNKREQEILYFFSLNKSVSEVAEILSILDDKPMNINTIQVILSNQLYPKFKAGNINQLLQNATKHGVVPSLMPDGK